VAVRFEPEVVLFIDHFLSSISVGNRKKSITVFASSASFFDEQGDEVMFKRSQAEAPQRVRNGLVSYILLQQGDVPQTLLSSFITIDTTSSLS
jgi:hypothetical protein